MKLGKKARRIDSRTLKLANYLTAELPPPKDSVCWSDKVPPDRWGMMRNMDLGDCTCAAAGHLIMQWTSLTEPTMAAISDDQIVAAYCAVGQYNPADPATDQGAVELDVLNYWRQTGIAGHKIDAFAEIDQTRADHVKVATELFGGCYIGLNLPTSAQAQTVWDVPAGGATGDGAVGSWGGHAVCVVAYDKDGLTCVTWGRAQRMTWAFFETYCDEAYALVSPDFIKPDDNETPGGLALDALLADLKAITGKPQPAAGG